MPAPLTTLANMHTILGLPGTDSSIDALLNLYIGEATAVILDHVKRVDFGLQPAITEIVSGYSTSVVALRQPPVYPATATGNTTIGSATITGLSTTTGLFVGQSVMGPGVPFGSMVASLSGSTIILGLSGQQTATPSLATATLTATPLAFGVAVYVDDNALGGWGSGAYGPGTQLTEGQDYYLNYVAGPGSACYEGVIYRPNGYFFRPGRSIGLIEDFLGPGICNIKVVYSAGYAVIPSPVQSAAEMLVARMRQSRMYGQMVSSLGATGLSASLSGSAKRAESWGILSEEITALLAPYVLVQV